MRDEGLSLPTRLGEEVAESKKNLVQMMEEEIMSIITTSYSAYNLTFLSFSRKKDQEESLRSFPPDVSNIL